MFRLATVILIGGLMYGLGVAGVAHAQSGQYGPRPESTKPPTVTAPTGEAKKPAEKLKTVSGTVKSVDATNLVVTVSGKTPKQYTFALGETTVKVGAKEGVAMDLKEGDAVRVTYTESDGKLSARSVVVKAAKAKK